MLSLITNPRFLLVGLASSYGDKEKMLADYEELESLVHTYGGRVFAAIVQNATRADNATYIGTGKAQEVADKIAEEKIDVVVVNDNVKSGQLYTLKKIFERSNSKIIVWDRVDLILQIFSKHASTAEAKLQIRLASIRHMGPRIFGMGMELSQQAGGIGTRGIGETNTELMRRHWKEEIRQVNKQLQKIFQNKYQQMGRRKREGLSTVSIVGYTNSGKTTLFNALGRKNNFVENTLFATLDSSVCKFYLPSISREVYLSDTIGFIQNLPPQLIDSFKSTLMETVHADLLLHVVDISDPRMSDKITAVEWILGELDVSTKNTIYVFNKIDLSKVDKTNELTDKYSRFNPQFISAKSQKGCDKLIETIAKTLLTHTNTRI